MAGTEGTAAGTAEVVMAASASTHHGTAEVGTLDMEVAVLEPSPTAATLALATGTLA